ncbi:hypothetical protein NDU88_006214 [Pleurodeles waltl]|uniref:DNA-directed RNA polymerase subunit n=1 Tax=Pleurodeles waltl TaxID=8319 RepID=A0AAV7MC83_PLEWA|nr:hypothetical protein NDU88_006214 [Pleurodeles waltl]
MVDQGISGSKVLLVGETQHVPEKSVELGGLSGTVLPSFSEASALLNSRYSCLVLDTHRRHMALPPKYLRMKKTGIRNQLNTELLRYSESLNGVPVAYDDIKIVGELGDIYDDQGYIHLTIEAEFVIFRPRAGEKLVGVVNKVAPSHIGCLVHGCFNASLPKPYKMLAEDWQNLGVKIGDELEFDVARLDSDAVGVFCIRGRLDFESLKAKSSETPSHVTSVIVGDVNQNVAVSLTKKQKMKFILNGDNMDSDTENAVDISEVLNTDNTVDNVRQHEKKKKKKHKQKDLTILESDSCGYLDDQKIAKKKKRKHSEDEEISEISQEPKAKKKRRN